MCVFLDVKSDELKRERERESLSKTWLRCAHTVKCCRISTTWDCRVTDCCRDTASSISSNILCSNTFINSLKYSSSSFGSDACGLSQWISKWAILGASRTAATLSCRSVDNICSASTSMSMPRWQVMTSMNLCARLQWIFCARFVIWRVIQKLVLGGSCDCSMPHWISCSVTATHTQFHLLTSEPKH